MRIRKFEEVVVDGSRVLIILAVEPNWAGRKIAINRADSYAVVKNLPYQVNDACVGIPGKIA